MTKKLKLSTETVRALDIAALEHVNGGGRVLGVIRTVFKNMFAMQGFISSGGRGG